MIIMRELGMTLQALVVLLVFFVEIVMKYISMAMQVLIPLHPVWCSLLQAG